ncbi:hypothetical protein BDV29DRAFT_185865 [Aspergillus leporis]|uniref:Uncharacterized protein n=1 Tax=Aspergillus leporis TaxID=41062 RepID=A0A5N5WGW3_9EURO|nr:hypothetical protein BDV29DRAFT_185865 [Aspergillus leporis]
MKLPWRRKKKTKNQREHPCPYTATMAIFLNKDIPSASQNEASLACPPAFTYFQYVSCCGTWIIILSSSFRQT